MPSNNKTLENLDHIYDAYKGKLGDIHGEATRERFAWLASKIEGNKVLDIGCSQGIFPILLAREGKKVLGIDIVKESITFAKSLSSQETKTTQDNLKFKNFDYLSHKIEGKFDVIILGEVLEHLYYPKKMIEKTISNLKSDGDILITTPFGINDYYDHRKTYYLIDLLKLLWPNFEIKDIKFSEIRRYANWVGIHATRRDNSNSLEKIPIEFVESLEKAIKEKERMLLNTIKGKDKDLQKEKILNNEIKKELLVYENTILYKNKEIEDLREKCQKAERIIDQNKKVIKRFKQRKIIRLINIMIGITKIPSRTFSKLKKKLKGIIKTTIRFTLDIKAQIVKKKLLSLAKDIPTSNGSAYYSKQDLNVAIITDEFAYNYYDGTMNLYYINKDNYIEVLDKDIDFLLFITCWFGMKDNDWRGLANDPSKREELYEIFNYAKKKGVKVVFQSKEDPSNYNIFLPISQKADYIFTSDKGKIENYKKDTGNSNVYLLEFGVNPLLHNPIGCNLRHDKKLKFRNKVFFAGSWNPRYSERKKDTRTIFDGVRSSNHSLIIADRNYEKPGYNYPFKYVNNIIPSLNYKTLQQVHKLFEWNININSIKYSETMCATRVYELQALGSLILSNYAISVYNKFPNIFIINNEKEVKNILNGYTEKERYKMRVHAIRNAFSGNTVFDRINKLLQDTKISVQINTSKKVLVITNEKTKKVEEMFNSQSFENKELITTAELDQKNKKGFDFITFFSNDNNYGEYYLEDMINCFKFVDTSYVTKASYYDSRDRLVGISHNYVDSYESKYKTIFSLKHTNIKEILSGDLKNKTGYSSDPFELNEKRYPTDRIVGDNKELGVILPIYNNGYFLYGKSFLSLRRSPIFKKMHILLVDDGSSENNTIRIVRRLAKQYPNISAFFFEKGGSGSASRARNKGLEILETKYISFFDPDDDASSDGYSKLLNKIKKKDYDFVLGYAEKIHKAENYHRRVYKKKGKISDPKEFLVKNNFFNHNIQACVFKREFLIKNKIRFLEGAFGEDSLFFIEIMLKANEFFYLDHQIFWYFNDRIGSASNLINKEFFQKSASREKKQVEVLENAELLDEYLDRKYFYFVKNWYAKKLTQVNPEDYEGSLSILKDIAGYYGFDLEKEYTEKYLDKIPKSDGTSYYKKFDVNIAIVTDSLAFDYFDNSASLFYTGPNNYKEVIDNNDINMFFFITCWRGINNEDWRGISGNPEVRSKLIDIFEYCKEKDIPTVFWSKEDPPHFDIYKEFAKYADYVFTTAEECIPDYKIYTRNKNIFLSQYGINPLIHNPVGFRVKNDKSFDSLNRVPFAGSWYECHPERVKDQSLLFDGVIESDKKLTIIDRNYFINAKNITYPRKYLKYTIPAIEYSKLQKFHKLFDWALNLNIVKNSETMCAARVFELQALGVTMISNPSICVNKNFPNIFTVNSSEEVTNILNNTSDEEIYRRQIEGIRNVYTDSTVFERLGDILYKVGLINEPLQPKEIVTICDSKSDKIVEMFNKQTYQNRKLITKEEAKNLKTDSFVTFFTEDYNYGIHYLQDMVNGFKYTDTAFVTKDPKVEHNYIDFTNDKYTTMFNPKKISIEDMLNKKEFKGEGYSIDPFELEKIN